MGSRKSIAKGKGRFARRHLWRTKVALEQREVRKAYEAGREAASLHSLWYDEEADVWGGPALTRFFHRQEKNAVCVARDIEEDCAALYQALNPVYARYKAALARLRDVDARIAGPAEKLERAKEAAEGADPLARRSLNQARLDIEPLLDERARTVAELDALRVAAEEAGLGDLRGIQGSRLADLEHHRARMDELLSFFLSGAVAELGVKTNGYSQPHIWSQHIIDGYVGQLEGQEAADGRWIMDFSEHDGMPCAVAL